MDRASRTLSVFGVYLFVVGWLLVLAPMVVLRPLGFASSVDGLPRIIGVVVVVLAGYYWVGAKSNHRQFFVSTVAGRAFVFVAFAVLVLLNLSRPGLLIFGVVDAAGALWTLLALRAGTARAPEISGLPSA